MRISLIPLVLVILFKISIAVGETECRVDVGFKWKQAQGETESSEPTITLASKGADEAAAKRALTPRIDREKQRAQKSCQERHEDLTSCVAGKLSALSSSLRQMGFSERKSVEDAVSADCSARQGKCSGVTVSEPQCAEIVAKADGTPGADEKGGKKDEKGKKK